MKARLSIIVASILALAAVAVLIVAYRPTRSGEPATVAEQNSPAFLKPLVEKIQAKAMGGGQTEGDFAPELAEIDALLAAHRADKSEETAQIHMLKVAVYLQIIENPEKALEIVRQIKAELPETQTGKSTDELIASLEPEVAAYRIRKTLVVGAPFPDFQETDTAGRPLSVSQFRGKVVLVDFWATWCGPCIAELPNVVATYRKFHGQGFEIVGVSLDDANQAEALAAFTRKHDMPWPQFYDGARWQGKLVKKYGINGIPATFLLDREGRIIGRDLRGAALEQAVASALAAK